MKYEKEYFDWQKVVGSFGGKVNKSKFEGCIKKEDVVVDFGSGGGYLLKNIVCSKKVGIEVNAIAREEAKNNGVNSVEKIDEIEDNYADVIISNHALEHVECPLDILKRLYLKLKTNGKIVFITPHDEPNKKYNPEDVNHHLYTWDRQSLGNLFKEAGFRDIEVYNIRSKWPRNYLKIYNIFGSSFFNFLCYLYALLKKNYQIKIIAKK